MYVLCIGTELISTVLVTDYTLRKIDVSKLVNYYCCDR